MADLQQLLDSVSTLQKNKDATGLVALREHEDKKVRKAVGKALHVLRSRGIEIPASKPRAWSTGDTLKKLRGDLVATAQIDTKTSPGFTRFLLSDPDEVNGARLFVGALTPDDRVVEFNAYRQTDGQRTRLMRDWTSKSGDRNVDVAWLKGRIRWAREHTVAGGTSVPRALDEALSLLGETPSARPGPFLGEQLASEPAFAPDKADELFVGIGVPLWPSMVDLEGMLQRAAEIHGDKPQPEQESARLELLKESVAGDEAARDGLRTTLANALEDASVHLWLEGNPGSARAVADMVGQLRESAEPEALEWAPRLLGYQVASLLRAMGGPEAVARARAEAEKSKQA